MHSHMWIRWLRQWSQLWLNHMYRYLPVQWSVYVCMLNIMHLSSHVQIPPCTMIQVCMYAQYNAFFLIRLPFFMVCPPSSNGIARSLLFLFFDYAESHDFVFLRPLACIFSLVCVTYLCIILTFQCIILAEYSKGLHPLNIHDYRQNSSFLTHAWV